MSGKCSRMRASVLLGMLLFFYAFYLPVVSIVSLLVCSSTGVISSSVPVICFLLLFCCSVLFSFFVGDRFFFFFLCMLIVLLKYIFSVFYTYCLVSLVIMSFCSVFVVQSTLMVPLFFCAYYLFFCSMHVTSFMSICSSFLLCYRSSPIVFSSLISKKCYRQAYECFYHVSNYLIIIIY